METEDLTIAGGVVAEARNLVEDYIKAEVITIEEPGTGLKVAAIRKGNDVVPIRASTFDDYRDEPLRRAGTATLLSLDSFIDHVNRFKDTSSLVFANNSRTAPTITAVLDYNPAGGAADALPRFGKHRSHYAFPLSDEWKAWLAKDGAAMGMADFAEFLEERIIDVLFLEDEDSLPEDVQRALTAMGGGRASIATPNKLMELSRNLQVNESSTAVEAVNLQSGEAKIRFESTHTDGAGGPVNVPSIFLIGIPVFNSGQIWRLAARLRYRKTGGKIVFWYDLWRVDRTFDAAFNGAVEQVKADTDLPVLLGGPEA